MQTDSTDKEFFALTPGMGASWNHNRTAAVSEGRYVFSAPALRFWSAPAERSRDGALDFRRASVLTQGSGLARAPNPKRRGASLPSLPATLQKWVRPVTRAGTIPQLVGSALNTYEGPAAASADAQSRRKISKRVASP